MPADLVPGEAIPQFAARVDSREMLEVLRRVQKAGVILRGEADRATAAILQRLAKLGLVDAGYDGGAHDKPHHWVSNGNGSRVLSYLTGIRAGPHYEIHAAELAEWLEQQGTDTWWNVDGDPLLTGRLTFPCPADELAAELRKIDLPLLVQANKDDAGAKGQLIKKDRLDGLVGRFAEGVAVPDQGQAPPGGGDRVLYLCWKGSANDWLLVEDRETTEEMRADEEARASGGAKRK